MKLGKAMIFGFVVLVLAGALTVSSASAQPIGIMNDVWFKLRVVGHGYLINDVTQAVNKAICPTAPAYMHLTWNPDIEEYEYQIWTEGNPGFWSYTDGSFAARGKDNHFISHDVNWEFRVKTWTIRFYHTFLFTVHATRAGKFVSAELRTLGGEMYLGIDNVNVSFYGGVKVSGISIPKSKLPFKPDADDGGDEEEEEEEEETIW
jgi:hypothetical protein